jgi:hypothetical protein
MELAHGEGRGSLGLTTIELLPSCALFFTMPQKLDSSWLIFNPFFPEAF